MLGLLTACPQLSSILAPSKLSGPITGTGPVPTTPPDASQVQMLAAVNTARSVGRTCGGTLYPAAPALGWNSSLAKAATLHSQDMAARDYFAHQTPEGGTFDTRISAQGYTWSVAGENIAAGYSTLEAVVQGWLVSPSHCQNLMSPEFREVGMGSDTRAGSKYGVYWTQDFAAPR